MNVRIEIDTRTFVRFWLVVIGFALAALSIYMSQAALILVGAAFFFAIILSPPVNRLAGILPSKSRALGTAISYFAVVLVLGIVVFLVIPPIVEQTVKFAQNVPSLVDSATDQYKGANDFIQKNNLQPEVDKFLNSIKSGATKYASGVGSTIIAGIGSAVSLITSGILVFVLTFLMLVEGPTWMNRLWSVYEDKERMEHHRKVIGRMYNVVTGYAVGQLSVSSIAGFVAGIMVFILSFVFNIPANLAVPTAAIVFTTSLIPMFGAMIGAFIVALILSLNNITAAIVFILFFILYQQIEGNYISPKIQSKRINLSALAILVAVTIGIYLFGIVGGIISIPIAGCINVLAEDYFHSIKKKRIKNEKPITKFFKEIQSKL